jgi:hypothetical protein
VKHSPPRARHFRRAVDDYNQKAKDVRADIENVHRELEEEYDARSDDWKDGEKGMAVKGMARHTRIAP